MLQRRYFADADAVRYRARLLTPHLIRTCRLLIRAV